MSQGVPSPPYPGIPQPMSIGQMLDRIFRLFRANLGLLVKVSLVPAGALAIVYGVIVAVLFAVGAFPKPPHPPDPQKLGWALFAALLPAMLGYMVVHAVFEAASTYAALCVNAGVKTSFREAYSMAWSNAGRYIWLSILRTVIVMVPILLCLALIAGITALFEVGGHNNFLPGTWFFVPPLLMLLYLGWLVYAFLMMVRLAAAPAASINERLAATSAIRRSFELSRNGKGRIFLVILMVWAVSCLTFMVIEMVGFILFGITMFAVLTLHINRVAGMVLVALPGVGFLAVVLLWSVLLYAAYILSFVVLYHDQRLRLEGAAPALPAGEPA